MTIGGKSKKQKPQRGGRNQRFTNRTDRPRGEPGEVTRAWVAKNEEEEEEDSEESSEEESGSDSNGSENSNEEEVSGDAIEKAAPVKKEKAAREPIVDIENPNRLKKDTTKASDLIDAPRELSRKEREEKEKGEAKARYWKLHLQGKTEQAQSDLARLAVIRKQREEAAKQREAEKKAKEDEAKAKLASKKGQH